MIASRNNADLKVALLIPFFARTYRQQTYNAGGGAGVNPADSIDQDTKNCADYPPLKNRSSRTHHNFPPGAFLPGARTPRSYQRSRQRQRQEAISLVEALWLSACLVETVQLRTINPATLIGKGKLLAFKQKVRDLRIKLVVIDHSLSATQQRNLENLLETKVIDRPGLILEIFAKRARSREGRLQVELAYLNYQKSRLVRSWTHLERQRGGLGAIGGPGEKQIESDRRQIQSRINSLEQDLEHVMTTRHQQRGNNWRKNTITIALVGYTNAGKSSLFNRLTNGHVKTHDMLFATLDPTLRKATLPHGRTVVIADTVGFIASLPTNLIAAFRATLEEVTRADLIVHVHDITQPDRNQRADEVTATLNMLGVNTDNAKCFINVYNKIDLIDQEQNNADFSELIDHRYGQGVALSAKTGKGIVDLLLAIEDRLANEAALLAVKLQLDQGQQLAWLYQHGEILKRNDDQTTGEVFLSLRLPKRYLQDYRTLFISNGY